MRRFDIKLDAAAINSWYAARELPTIPTASFPTNGLIVPGKAAGFLYLTDSDIGLAEGLITNPAAPTIARGRALDRILRGLVVIAKMYNVRHLLGFAALASTERLANNHGFKSERHYVLTHRDMGL